MNSMTIARSELVLGGQKSGKSRRAELLARQWLTQSDAHRAVLAIEASWPGCGLGPDVNVAPPVDAIDDQVG